MPGSGNKSPCLVLLSRATAPWILADLLWGCCHKTSSLQGHQLIIMFSFQRKCVNIKLLISQLDVGDKTTQTTAYHTPLISQQQKSRYHRYHKMLHYNSVALKKYGHWGSWHQALPYDLYRDMSSGMFTISCFLLFYLRASAAGRGDRNQLLINCFWEPQPRTVHLQRESSSVDFPPVLLERGGKRQEAV